MSLGLSAIVKMYTMTGSRKSVEIENAVGKNESIGIVGKKTVIVTTDRGDHVKLYVFTWCIYLYAIIILYIFYINTFHENKINIIVYKYRQ